MLANKLLSHKVEPTMMIQKTMLVLATMMSIACCSKKLRKNTLLGQLLKKNAYLRGCKRIIKTTSAMAPLKLLPYGVSDFKQIRRENMYTVDKTRYIPKMEYTDHFLFLIRPRRFGKSVFLSMLRAYYDINERDNFQNLFQGLWIAENPTPERGTFQVMYFDYSRIGGTTAVLELNFDDYCGKVVYDFAERYQQFYPEGFARQVHSEPNFRAKLNYIQLKAARFGHKLYLIIDEYDNFTNTVLNEEGEAIYHALTHANGFYRDIFKFFKGMFARILMMGVSPVTMDDLSSGNNIASNISLRAEFNLMLGFSEADVRQMIRYYMAEGKLNGKDEEALLDEMRPWYDNYCFSSKSVDTDPKMFNCDMVLYYLNRVMQTGESPEQMIDPNTETDYSKMRKLIQRCPRRRLAPDARLHGIGVCRLDERTPADGGGAQPAGVHDGTADAQPLLPRRTRDGNEPRLLRLLPHARHRPLPHGAPQLHSRIEIPQGQCHRGGGRTAVGTGGGADTRLCAKRAGEEAHPRHVAAPHRRTGEGQRDDSRGRNVIHLATRRFIRPTKHFCTPQPLDHEHTSSTCFARSAPARRHSLDGSSPRRHRDPGRRLRVAARTRGEGTARPMAGPEVRRAPALGHLLGAGHRRVVEHLRRELDPPRHHDDLRAIPRLV